MIKKPLLSVITPVYNGVNFIAGCYNNLISQSFQDWEWIVVDDGSTDGTEDAVKKINDDRIHLFSYKEEEDLPGHWLLMKAGGSGWLFGMLMTYISPTVLKK